MSARSPRKPKVFTAEDRARLEECEAVIARYYGPPGIARPVRHGITKRDSRPHDVYIHLDAGDAVLYVGISLSLANRTGSHRAGSPWWKQIATIRVEHFPNRESALTREAELIAELRPPNNSAGIPAEPAIKRARTAERIVSSFRVDAVSIVAAVELGETGLVTPEMVADLRAVLAVLEAQL